MTEREALKLALEALKHMCHYTSAQTGYKAQIVADAMSAIDEALAQPEQEPVAYWDDEKTFVLPKQKEWDRRTGGISTFGCDTPLYTTPPQSKQEPVAKNENGSITWLVDNWPQNCLLYTIPPQRKPLTDEQIEAIAKNYALINPTTPLHFARAIEAKLKEKNALA